jgi:hypothetical protein
VEAVQVVTNSTPPEHPDRQEAIMSQSRDLSRPGYEGRALHLARYLTDDDKTIDQAYRYGVPTRQPDTARNLDDIGHAVNVRQVPDFWKPCEDWTLD